MNIFPKYLKNKLRKIFENTEDFIFNFLHLHRISKNRNEVWMNYSLKISIIFYDIIKIDYVVSRKLILFIYIILNSSAESLHVSGRFPVRAVARKREPWLASNPFSEQKSTKLNFFQFFKISNADSRNCWSHAKIPQTYAKKFCQISDISKLNQFVLLVFRILYSIYDSSHKTFFGHPRMQTLIVHKLGTS